MSALVNIPILNLSGCIGVTDVSALKNFIKSDHCYCVMDNGYYTYEETYQQMYQGSNWN